MGSSRGPRSGIPEPYEGYPAIGINHEVVPNQQLREFMFDFSRYADDVFTGQADQPLVVVNELPEESLATPAQLEYDSERPGIPPSDYDPRKYYRIFDPEKLGVRIIDMDTSKRAAHAMRSLWQKNDLGAVEKDARNEVDRRLPNTAPRLFFNRVESVGRRLPNAPKSDVRQKIALMPDTSRFPETIDLLDSEAEIVSKEIRRRLKQFVYSWDTVPSVTFAVFRQPVETSQITKITERVNDHLAKYPFAARLGSLSFRTTLDR